MLHDAAVAIWFFMPAAAANAAPIPFAKVPFIRHWNTPIDGGHLFRGKPILGPHKTWRGIVVGIAMATLAFWLEQLLTHHTHWAAQLLPGGRDYSQLPTLLIGPLFAIGALGGDAIKSFFKRQHNTPAGKTWFPFDQIDYIIGGSLLVAPYIRLNLAQYVWLLMIWFVMHLVVSYLGFRIHLKDSPI